MKMVRPIAMAAHTAAMPAAMREWRVDWFTTRFVGTGRSGGGNLIGEGIDGRPSRSSSAAVTAVVIE